MAKDSRSRFAFGTVFSKRSTEAAWARPFGSTWKCSTRSRWKMPKTWAGCLGGSPSTVPFELFSHATKSSFFSAARSVISRSLSARRVPIGVWAGDSEFYAFTAAHVIQHAGSARLFAGVCGALVHSISCLAIPLSERPWSLRRFPKSIRFGIVFLMYGRQQESGLLPRRDRPKSKTKRGSIRNEIGYNLDSSPSSSTSTISFWAAWMNIL